MENEETMSGLHGGVSVGEHLPAPMWSLSQRVHVFPTQEDLGCPHLKPPRVPSPSQGFCSRSLCLGCCFLFSLVVVWAYHASFFSLSTPAPRLQPPFLSCTWHCGHDRETDLALKKKNKTKQWEFVINWGGFICLFWGEGSSSGWLRVWSHTEQVMLRGYLHLSRCPVCYRNTFLQWLVRGVRGLAVAFQL